MLSWAVIGFDTRTMQAEMRLSVFLYVCIALKYIPNFVCRINLHRLSWSRSQVVIVFPSANFNGRSSIYCILLLGAETILLASVDCVAFTGKLALMLCVENTPAEELFYSNFTWIKLY